MPLIRMKVTSGPLVPRLSTLSALLRAAPCHQDPWQSNHVKSTRPRTQTHANRRTCRLSKEIHLDSDTASARSANGEDGNTERYFTPNLISLPSAPDLFSLSSLCMKYPVAVNLYMGGSRGRKGRVGVWKVSGMMPADLAPAWQESSGSLRLFILLSRS